MSNGEIGYWSEPFPWSPNRDPQAVPHGVRSGDWIRSDLIIRPQFISNWPNSIYPNYIWEVFEGYAFMITPPVKAREMCQGMVLNQFQLWIDEPLSLEVQEATKLLLSMLSEEEIEALNYVPPRNIKEAL